MLATAQPPPSHPPAWSGSSGCGRSGRCPPGLVWAGFGRCASAGLSEMTLFQSETRKKKHKNAQVWVCPLSHFKVTVTLTTHRPVPAPLQCGSSWPVAVKLVIYQIGLSNMNSCESLIKSTCIQQHHLIWMTSYLSDNKSLYLPVHWCLSQIWLLPPCPPGRELSKVHLVLMPEKNMHKINYNTCRVFYMNS